MALIQPLLDHVLHLFRALNGTNQHLGRYAVLPARGFWRDYPNMNSILAELGHSKLVVSVCVRTRGSRLPGKTVNSPEM